MKELLQKLFSNFQKIFWFLNPWNLLLRNYQSIEIFLLRQKQFSGWHLKLGTKNISLKLLEAFDMDLLLLKMVRQELKLLNLVQSIKFEDAQLTVSLFKWYDKIREFIKWGMCRKSYKNSETFMHSKIVHYRSLVYITFKVSDSTVTRWNLNLEIFLNIYV